MKVKELIEFLATVDPELPIAVNIPSDYVAQHVARANKVELSKIYTWSNMRDPDIPPCVFIGV